MITKTNKLIFKDMDMGLRWLLFIIFAVLFIENGIKGMPSNDGINLLGPWTLPQIVYIGLSLIYVGYLLVELIHFTGIKLPKVLVALWQHALFTASMDLFYFTGVLILQPQGFPYSMPLLMYFVLIFTLRSQRNRALQIGCLGMVSYLLMAWVVTSPNSITLYHLFSSLQLLLFSLIVSEIHNILHIFFQKNVHALAEIEHKNALLELSSKTDFLTEMLNHQAFYHALEHLMKQNISCSLILFDIDNFKKINDTYGHLTGDTVLKEVSALIRQSLRQKDIAARYGGEEFAILLPEIEAINAWIIADRIRETVSKYPFSTELGPLTVTLSGGVGTTTERLDKAMQAAFIDTVDKRLYEAKAAGKNQVLSTPLPESTLPKGPQQKGFLKAMDQMHHALNQLQLRLASDLTRECLQERFRPLEQNLLMHMVTQLDEFAAHPETMPYLLAAPLKDDVTLATHNLRTAFYALHLAHASEVSKIDRIAIGLAAILHDIGKLKIPVAIINKPGKLTAEEYALVKNHSAYGHELVTHEGWLAPSVKQAILNHHERLDGSGYPRQLSADALALPERILAVADVFDAMTSHRVYKPSVSIEQALDLLQTEEIHRLDSQLVQILIPLTKGVSYASQHGQNRLDSRDRFNQSTEMPRFPAASHGVHPGHGAEGALSRLWWPHDDRSAGQPIGARA